MRKTARGGKKRLTSVRQRRVNMLGGGALGGIALYVGAGRWRMVGVGG